MKKHNSVKLKMITAVLQTN